MEEERRGSLILFIVDMFFILSYRETQRIIEHISRSNKRIAVIKGKKTKRKKGKKLTKDFSQSQFFELDEDLLVFRYIRELREEK